MSTLRLRNLAKLSVEQQVTDNINFEIAVEEFANKKAREVSVENRSFRFRNKDVLIFFPMSFLLFV